MSTRIEWADEVWNPTVGCSRVSPGCDRCYAMGVAHRAMQPAHEGLTVKRPGEPVDWTGEVRCLPDRLVVPTRWKRRRRVFVDSMSDLFHPDVPSSFIGDVFGVMADTPQHIYMVLTKRPQRMADLLGGPQFWFDMWRDRPGAIPTHLPNVWLGTSIESDRYAFRADHLRAIPHTAVRFVSAEPLLTALPSLDLTGIDWVITGGESGPGARPIRSEWVRDLRDRCAARTVACPNDTDGDGNCSQCARHDGRHPSPVAFFHKQWGEWLPDDQAASFGVDAGYCPAIGEWDRAPASADAHRVGKHAAGRTLDGRHHDDRPGEAP